MIIAGITAAAFDGVAKWVMFMLSIGCGGTPHTLTFTLTLSPSPCPELRRKP